jgi:hypothetical protein
MRLLSLQPPGLRNKFRMFPLAAVGVLLLAPSLPAQAKRYPLESTAGLRLHNVVAEPAVLQGKKGLRITPSEEARRRLQSMTPDEQLFFPQLASIEGLEFANGVIEAEIAGAPAQDAPEGPRGYVGMPSASGMTAPRMMRSTFGPQMVAPTIKSGGITPSSTSHTPIGHFLAYGRRLLPNTSRTPI